jgi:hypothetical protein
MPDSGIPRIIVVAKDDIALETRDVSVTRWAGLLIAGPNMIPGLSRVESRSFRSWFSEAIRMLEYAN